MRWPRDLTASHNRQILERQTLRDKEEAERKAQEKAARAMLFTKRAAELEWLSFEESGLLIRPCLHEDELIEEGRQLHHCVASYAKRYAEGQTAILFIRRTEEPDEPFFTLEFDEERMVVSQNRGKRNCGRTPEVEEFEKAWLDHVRKIKAKGRIRAA